MPKLPSQVVKARSRALTQLHESYFPHAALVGQRLRAWFSERAADGVNLAGRSKHGVQVIVPPQEGLLGCSALVLVAAPEGIAALNAAHPDVRCWTASIDSHLNEVGYIIPGLGDAGDKIFGTN